MSDLIDRQQAIDAVRATLLSWSYMPEWRDNKIIEAVEQLPPTEPKRIRGKWIYGEDSMADCVDGYRCDQCGFSCRGTISTRALITSKIIIYAPTAAQRWRRRNDMGLGRHIQAVHKGISKSRSN